jgi:hypothetical protein
MIGVRLHWVSWALIALVIYMAFRAPATLAAVGDSIIHLLGVIASAITHFLGAATGKS